MIVLADTDAAFASLASLAAPGTIIMLKRGNTYKGPVAFKASGTAAAPIVITAYGSGPAPVITGSPSIYADCLVVSGSYVVIDKIGFANTNRAAVQIPASGSHIDITNCEMSALGIGANIVGSFVRCLGNYVHDLTMVKNTPKPTNDDYGANGFVIAGNNVEVAYNRVLRARAASDDYGTDGGGIEIFGAVTNLSIHDNWVEDSEGFLEGGGPAGATVTNVSIYRNVSLNNGTAVSLHNAGGAFGVNWVGLDFCNNTLIEEDPAASTVLIRMDGPPQPSINFKRNIFYMGSGDSVWKQPGAAYHADNDFYIGTPKATHLFNNWGMTLSPGEKIADPLFVDLESRNLALKSNSPAFGAGAF